MSNTISHKAKQGKSLFIFSENKRKWSMFLFLNGHGLHDVGRGPYTEEEEIFRIMRHELSRI